MHINSAFYTLLVSYCSILTRLVTDLLGSLIGVELYAHCIAFYVIVCFVITGHEPSAGSGVIRIDPLRFLARCRTRQLNQA